MSLNSCPTRYNGDADNEWQLTDEDDGHHMPACGDVDAAADHAVRRDSLLVKLSQFHQCLVHIHGPLDYCFPVTENTHNMIT